MDRHLRAPAASAFPIIVYHNVSDHPSGVMRPFAVAPSTFRRQLGVIASSGSTALTVSAFVAARDDGVLPKRPVVITFDDGFADFYESALPALEEHGFPCTLYVTTGFLDGSPEGNASLRPPDPMLKWSRLGELARRGVEIGAHSHRHPHLDTLRRRDARDEIDLPKSLLERELGAPVASFAYPHGYSSRTVRRLVRDAGYTSACAVKNALSPPDDDRYALARLMILRTTASADLEAWLNGAGAPVARRADRVRTRLWRLHRRLRAVATGVPGTDFGGDHG